MMHLAIHDALNAIDPRYEAYLPVESVGEADPMAAATTAEVALQLYPAEKAQLDEELGWLASVPEGPRRTLGIELGKATAAAVLKARTGDGWDNEAEYQWHPMGPVRRKLEARFKA